MMILEENMPTIWKYTLPMTGNTLSLEIPWLYADDDGYTAHNFEKQILHLGVQDGFPTLWVMVDPDSPKQTVNIQMFGTGFNCPKDGYIGTVLLLNDSLVLHAFLMD
jgi:hypothetical protein